jgi:hypothetical protein
LIVADQLLDLGAARPPLMPSISCSRWRSRSRLRQDSIGSWKCPAGTPFALRVIDCSAFDARRRSLAAKVHRQSEWVEQADGEAGDLKSAAHSGRDYLAGWLGASRIHDPTGGGGTSKGGLAGPEFSCFEEHATPKQRMASATARYFIGKAFSPE